MPPHKRPDASRARLVVSEIVVAVEPQRRADCTAVRQACQRAELVRAEFRTDSSGVAALRDRSQHRREGYVQTAALARTALWGRDAARPSQARQRTARLSCLCQIQDGTPVRTRPVGPASPEPAHPAPEIAGRSAAWRPICETRPPIAFGRRLWCVENGHACSGHHLLSAQAPGTSAK